MKTEYFAQGNSALIVYFAGWGTPPSAVKMLDLVGKYDLLICYDYRDLQLDFDFSTYQDIYLVAWSLGVWVAERAMQHIPLCQAIAVNGTGFPNDDCFGIPTQIFNGTLAGLNEDSRSKFERRMCQDKVMLATYQQLPDHRLLSDIHQELALLANEIERQPPVNFVWDLAWIATQDRIFPTENQLAYWQGRCEIKQIKAGHYMFPLFERWEMLWQR